MIEQKTFPARGGGVFSLGLDHSRDDLLTQFGKATLTDRYLQPGEDFQSLFGRVCAYFASSQEHAQRLYDYMSNHWFMASTPILSNGGTERGNPISCFLNYVPDDLEGIADTFDENIWLASRGGGIGTYWGDVRGIGETVGRVGESSGVTPFLKTMDSQTLAISQGSLRRGSAAVYLDIDHPEIEEFLELREPKGDLNRKSLNLHHGVNITDAFMEAVRDDADWDLIGRADGSVRKTVKARSLWIKMLQMRMKTGEPYMLFIDTVNREAPEHHKFMGLHVRQSNLCSEITLPTNEDRTAVCCLASLNAEYFTEWSGDYQFIDDVCWFLDNVLQDFIDRNEGKRGFERAVFSAMMERSIGLGLMGFHSYLQKLRVPFESKQAVHVNKTIFKFIEEATHLANKKAAKEVGPCPDSQHAYNKMLTSYKVRWSNVTSVAPTASISVIAGNASPCIEPWPANVFTQKTLSGSFTVRNKSLNEVLKDYYQLSEEDLKNVWSDILANEGSVQHLEFMNDTHKEVFKTAWEIGPEWQLQHMADRADKIDQAISNNLFLRPDISTKELNAIHFNAWKRGVKSLYYCRSKSIARAQSVASKREAPAVDTSKLEACMVCQ